MKKETRDFNDLAGQITELKRELNMRERVYPDFIARGRLTEKDAARQTERLKAAIETLEAFRDATEPESHKNPRKAPGAKIGELNARSAIQEIADARLAFFVGNYAPVVAEFKHFEKAGQPQARPLADHVRELMTYNKQVLEVRDVFIAELRSLGYSDEQLRKLYADALAARAEIAPGETSQNVADSENSNEVKNEKETIN